jgi:predicted esterase
MKRLQDRVERASCAASRTRGTQRPLFLSMVLVSALNAVPCAISLDLREIDRHLEYLDRPAGVIHAEKPEMDPETYLYSLIGVIATLEAALAAEPSDPEVLWRLGTAHRIAASLDLGALLETVEDRPEAQFPIPDWQERLKLARDYLERARNLAPTNPRIYDALGRACGISQEELTKSVGYFERARTLAGPSVSASTLKWLAYVYGKTRRIEESFDTVEEYLRRYPANPDILELYMRAGFAQLSRSTERFPRKHSMIFLPDDYDPNERYPVLVDIAGLTMLFGYPWPGRPASLKGFDADAARKIRLAPHFGDHRSLIILIPMDFDEGQDISAWEGFKTLIEACEERVLSDLEKIKKWYSIDASRIGMCGFSASADLSWALCVRHPDVFHGAVVGGSRCSYVDKANIGELARRKARFYLTISGDDDAARVSGMESARRLLDDTGVEHVFVKAAAGGHSQEILDLEAAVEYLLFE